MKLWVNAVMGWQFLEGHEIEEIRGQLDSAEPHALAGTNAFSVSYLPLSFYGDALLLRVTTGQREANTHYFIAKDGEIFSERGADRKRQELDQKFGVTLNDSTIADCFRFVYFMTLNRALEPLVETAEDLRIARDTINFTEQQALGIVQPVSVRGDSSAYLVEATIYSEDGLDRVGFQFAPGESLQEISREKSYVKIPDPEFINTEIKIGCTHTQEFNPGAGKPLAGIG